MSSTSQPQPLPAATEAPRRRTRPLNPRPPRRTAPASGVTPNLGPANRAPGVSVMGGPSPGLHLDVMGGPDGGPRLPVMGEGDHGTRVDLLGHSDPRFVDSLFGFRAVRPPGRPVITSTTPDNPFQPNR